jgi:dihydroxyacetone kinase-like protein
MNVAMAMEELEAEGIQVKKVVANDDVPSAPKGQEERRRGVAGEILMWKVGGAKAAMGASLDEVFAAAKKAIENTRSMGVGLSPCIIPEVGHPNFTIPDGKMEIGIGHHGEPGIEVADLEPAAKVAERMCEVILPDLPFVKGDEVVVLISGLGATPVMELYILFQPWAPGAASAMAFGLAVAGTNGSAPDSSHRDGSDERIVSDRRILRRFFLQFQEVR